MGNIEEMVLKRRVRAWPTRIAAFVKIGQGLIHENGTVVRLKNEDLAAILDLVMAERWGQEAPRTLYLVGGWDAAHTPATEWFGEYTAGWKRTAYRRSPLVADYVHQATGRKLRINMTAQWFGSCDSASICCKAFVRLRQLLRSAFDAGVSLMGTPARTGLDLIERSLPRQLNKATKEQVAYEYPMVPDALREKIEHNIGQGRMEWLAQPGSQVAEEGAEKLYAVDAIWMYMACVRRLPVGPIEHDDINELADNGYRPGFYRVHFKVPAGWAHIGLLSVWEGRPVWPRISDGQLYETYATGDELRLAFENSWPVRILERWLFAEAEAPGADPLRTWADKLKTLRDACTDQREKELGKPLRDAIRSIAIMAIGSLHRRGRYELVETPIEESESLPEEAVHNLDEDAYGDGTVIRWWKSVELDMSMLQFRHPEWPAMVWRRASARLARAALKIPFEKLVALRTDEFIATVPVDWPDDGKPGTFRMKGAPIDLAGRPIPENEQQYQRVRREARASV